MAVAYVLVNVGMKQERSVQEELLQLDGVKEAYRVYGTYDVVVKIEVENLDKLKEVVRNKVRNIENIHSTSTLIVTPSYEWGNI